MPDPTTTRIDRVQGPTTATSYVQGPTTATSHVQGPITATSHVQGPTSATGHVQGPTTATGHVQGPSTATSHVQGPTGTMVSHEKGPTITTLSREAVQRYARHLVLPEVGIRGQERLAAGSVLIVGAGGLGSPVALYLVAAGVGRIGIIDDDRVDATNLQRQVLYGEPDVGRHKVDAARDRLLALDAHAQIETHAERLTAANAIALVSRHDVIVDGTDNFATRYLVNDACVLAGKPYAYGSILRFEGQAAVFGAQGGPCYRCLFPTPPPAGSVPDCAEGGVLGVLPGIIGSIQATEVLKLLLGDAPTLAGRLLLFDAWTMETTTVQVRRDPACAVCGDKPTIKEPTDQDAFCGVATPATAAATIEVATLAKRLAEGDDILVVDVREPGETEIAAIRGARNIPLRGLRGALDTLPRDREIVLHCRTDVRAARAWQALRDAGFQRVRVLRGGILAWQEEVEPQLLRY